MRVFLTMLGYNTAEMVRGAMENLETTTTDAEHRHIVKLLFTCGFPMPNAEQNRRQLKKLGAEFGWLVADIPNRGVVENHNVAIHEHCHLEPGDFYVTFDPDVRMQQVGWVSAMVEILKSLPDTVFVTAARPFYDEQWLIDGHGREVHKLPSGTRYATFRQLVAWSMGMYKGEWLATRQRDFAAVNEWYGWSEHCEYDRMLKCGKNFVATVDHYDHHLGADPIYCQWKVESANGVCKTDFATWLEARK